MGCASSWSGATPLYAKWFGTAFSGWGARFRLGPVLEAVLRTGSWKERESRLSGGLRHLGRDARRPRPHAGRSDTGSPATHAPAYLVLHAGRFAAALEGAIGDPGGTRIRHRAGALDQICDSTDVLAHPDTYPQAASVLRVSHGEEVFRLDGHSSELTGPERSGSALLLAPMHPSAWKGCSRNFGRRGSSKLVRARLSFAPSPADPRPPPLPANAQRA
jgi:hypothetical protein